MNTRGHYGEIQHLGYSAIGCSVANSSRGVVYSLPTLDVTQLSPSQLGAAEQIFHELKHHQMLPFNEMVDDLVRQKLDRLLLSKVLGLGEDTHLEVHEGLDLLRKKLCAEPSIHGGKADECDLEKEAPELIHEDSSEVQIQLLL